MDVSNKFKRNWHGKWIWGNFITSRRKNYGDRSNEPKGLSRDEVNTFVLARRCFTLEKEIQKAVLHITADSRYQLYVNGEFLGKGINRCEANYWYYDDYDIAPFLKKGKNVIALKVRWFGWDLAYYTPPENPGSGKENSAKGGLLFDLNLKFEDGDEKWIGSDKETKIIKDPSERSDMPLKNGCLGFIEEVDLRKLPSNWNETDFDDSSWEDPLILDYPIKTILLDTNHPLHEEFFYPSEILNIGECKDTAFEFEDGGDEEEEMDFNIQHLIEPPPEQVEHFEVKNIEGLCQEEEITEISPKKGAKGQALSIFLKFEKEMVGYPHLIVEGGSGTIIDIIPSEKARGKKGPELNWGNKRGMRLILSDESNPTEFQQWTWEGYLYMLIKIRNLEETLKIHKLGTIQTHMRITEKGTFQSDNEKLNELWDVCAYTLLCCGIDAYLDCPSREQRAYLGDAYPEALIANACFGEPRLTKKLIEDSCFGQRSDGLMYSFHPGDAKLENHIIPDYTLYLIQITKDYYEYYGDEDILVETFPHFQRAIEWFWKYLDPEDGLLGDLPYWCFIDWSFAHNKPGKWAILNAQFMDVLYFLSDVAHKVGRKDVEEKYRSQADQMKRSIEALFWDQSEKCYKDYHYQDQLHGLSYMTNTYLIKTDVAPRKKWDSIIKRVFEYPGAEEDIKRQIDEFYLKRQSHHRFGDELKDMVVVAQPFFMHHVNQALAKANRYDIIMKFLKKWIPMMELGETGTIWETWSIAGSECHAWAATPAYDLSTHWMGVKPKSPGFEEVLISPTFYELQKVNGTYPSCKGLISVKWEKVMANMVEVEIQIPPNITSGMFEIPKLGVKSIKRVEFAGNSIEKGEDNSKGKELELDPGMNKFRLQY